MARTNPISPFPSDIDRDAFGHYLSGFTDGEGCFQLGIARDPRSTRRTPFARFKIQLRDDDSEVLRLIQSFLGCGTLYHDPRIGSVSKPAMLFRVDSHAELASVVVPHFVRYPLRAKKARDFPVWRDGLDLIRRVTASPFAYSAHRLPKWTEPVLAQFVAIADQLNRQRAYAPPAA